MVFKLFSNREFNCHNHLSSCWKGPWLNHSYRLYTGCIILYDSYRMSHTVWLILESPYWEFQLIIFFSWGWPKVWKQTFRKSVLSIQVSHIDFDLSNNQIRGYHKLQALSKIDSCVFALMIIAMAIQLLLKNFLCWQNR